VETSYLNRLQATLLAVVTARPQIGRSRTMHLPKSVACLGGIDGAFTNLDTYLSQSAIS